MENDECNVIESAVVGKEETERRIRLRRKVLEEIINSEKSYLAQMDMLLNKFVKPVQEKELLSKKNFSSVFGDIEPIYALNKTLYDELLAQDNVGSAFCKIAPYLKLYSTYAHDYDLASKVLQDLRKRNREFEAFISQIERLPDICRKLEALLIVPIQRVPRYRLLLAELISHTHEEDPELPILNSALAQVESVARHINEQIRDQENMQRMIRIQKSLVHGKPKIVTPGRRFVREGILKKVSSDGDSAHERHFILFSDMLLYCKVRCSDTTQQSSLACSCVLPLRHCQAEAVMDEGKQWVDDINRAAQQLEANFRTLRKESSTRKPIRKHQLRHGESLSRTFRQRHLPEKRKAAAARNCEFDVQVLRCYQEQPNQNDSRQSPEDKRTEWRSSKLLKWPGSCPGTPGFPYSPRKLLAMKSLSPSSSEGPQESRQMFYSPPIQTGPARDFDPSTEQHVRFLSFEDVPNEDDVKPPGYDAEICEPSDESGGVASNCLSQPHIVG